MKPHRLLALLHGDRSRLCARGILLPPVRPEQFLSPTIRLSADAGPLLLERADGSTEITAGGSVQYAQEFEHGCLSRTYDRTARVAGALGEVTTGQGLTGSSASPPFVP